MSQENGYSWGERQSFEIESESMRGFQSSGLIIFPDFCGIYFIKLIIIHETIYLFL